MSGTSLVARRESDTAIIRVAVDGDLALLMRLIE